MDECTDWAELSCSTGNNIKGVFSQTASCSLSSCLCFTYPPPHSSVMSYGSRPADSSKVSRDRVEKKRKELQCPALRERVQLICTSSTYLSRLVPRPKHDWETMVNWPSVPPQLPSPTQHPNPPSSPILSPTYSTPSCLGHLGEEDLDVEEVMQETVDFLVDDLSLGLAPS